MGRLEGFWSWVRKLKAEKNVPFVEEMYSFLREQVKKDNIPNWAGIAISVVVQCAQWLYNKAKSLYSSNV